MKQLIIFFLIVTLIKIKTTTKPLTIKLTHEEPTHELEQKFSNSDHNNKYKIQLDDMELLENNQLYLIVESDEPNLIVSILDGVEETSKSLLDITGQSGNIMFIMDDKYFNDHLKYFKEGKELGFKIKGITQQKPDYKIKVQVQVQGELTAGKSYTTRVDQNIGKIQVLYSYKNNERYNKIRFQTQVLKANEHNYRLDVKVQDPSGGSYILNQVFKKIVGGMIDGDHFNICKKENCDYTMNFQLQGIKTLIIECQVAEKTEQIIYQHYGPYYDRKYAQNQITSYYLPYDEQVSDLDVTITLTPVTGKTTLFVNPSILPINLDNYLWKETGLLAKRITIRKSELRQMQNEKADLYITVQTEEPGEYLLNIVAHEENLKGVLDHGIIEGGFVQGDEINTYLYLFEVFKSRTIQFDVTMNVMTGNADLYLKQCESLEDCEFNEQNIKFDSVLNVENEQEKKMIRHNFQCQHDQTFPSVKGKENHGTHYDITIHEDQQHRLLTPGHLLKLNLGPQEKEFFKFSYPKQKSQNSKLVLSIEAVWGNFSVYISKNHEYPTAKESEVQQSFESSKSGLYSSFKQIILDSEKFNRNPNDGAFYIGVEALNSCQVNLKFYELDDDTTIFHFLRAGEQQRGIIHKPNQMTYFNIKASLTEEQASTVTINLTPIRGQFQIFTARDGKFPTKNTYDLTSKNNVLELTYDEYRNKEEYIIGVALLQENQIGEDFQFMISFNYSNKPVKLKPGILSNFYIKTQNYFVIEITSEMADLLVLQSFRDQIMSICGFFTGLENFNNVQDQCQFNEKSSISLYLNSEQLKDGCEKYDQNSCYFIVKINGEKNHKFTLGYTYNDKPFKIVEQNIIHGPSINKGNQRINFIQHVDKQKDVSIQFNNKGLDLQIFTKLIDGDKQGDQMLLQFPHQFEHDKVARLVYGNVSSITYDQSQLAEFGDNPEVLISIRPTPSIDLSEKVFDGNYWFQLHSMQDSFSLPRNSTVGLQLNSGEYNYFHFYNHGQHDFFTIQITANSNTFITVILAKDLNERMPFNNKQIKQETGFGSVILLLDKNDLQGNLQTDPDILKGYFTIAVKTTDDTNASIYWNNNPVQDIYELTPGHPMTIYGTEFREQYFSFYAKDALQPNPEKQRGKLKIYVNSQIRCNVYLTTDQKMDFSDLENLNKDYVWKSSIGSEGGIHVMQIEPNTLGYCVNCMYYGYIEGIQAGNVQIMISIEHDNFPIYLTHGYTYPEILKKDEKQIYQYYNGDTDQFNISFSILSGYIKIYVKNSPDVSPTNSVEVFEFGNENKYGFITIKPSKYKSQKGENYYFYIQSQQSKKSAFNMTIIKNSLKMPIEVGFTKQIGLGPLESSELFFQNSKNMKEFNFDFEIVKIQDLKLYQQASININSFIEVYQQIENQGKVKIPTQIEAMQRGRIRVKFFISDNKKQKFFNIVIYNSIDTFIQANVILTQDSYKMINMDENTVELVNQSKDRVFEVIASKESQLYFNILDCYGNVDIQFFEGDYDNVKNNNSVKHKTITQDQSLVHYIKPTHERIFIKVSTQAKQAFEESLINISIFNEKQLDSNPYTELSFNEQDGNVQIDTEKSEISFDQVLINSTYQSGYKHLIEYKVYFSESEEAIKFLRNCQVFYYKKFFPETKFFEFTQLVAFNSIEDVNKHQNQRITLSFKGVTPNKKLKGSVFAKVHLMQPDQNIVKPVKIGFIHYKTFTLLAPKYHFPFIYVVSIIFIVALLFVFYNIINDYVFGKIGQYSQLNKLSDLKGLEGNVFGFDTESILEDEFYLLKQKEKEGQVSVERHEEQIDDNIDEFEMTEKNVPLEMNL